MIVKAKRKRFGPKFTIQKKWKKAIITLAANDTITLLEGV